MFPALRTWRAREKPAAKPVLRAGPASLSGHEAVYAVCLGSDAAAVSEDAEQPQG
jgi:hypothetical protein